MPSKPVQRLFVSIERIKLPSFQKRINLGNKSNRFESDNISGITQNDSFTSTAGTAV